jgi:hypothetical protein
MIESDGLCSCCHCRWLLGRLCEKVERHHLEVRKNNHQAPTKRTNHPLTFLLANERLSVHHCSPLSTAAPASGGGGEGTIVGDEGSRTSRGDTIVGDDEQGEFTVFFHSE